jgi:hypothetical protein
MNRPRLRFPQHQIIPSRRLYDRVMLPVDLAAKKKTGAAPNRNAWSTSPAPKRLAS